MVVAPAGRFLMGGESGDQAPRHEVVLDTYEIHRRLVPTWAYEHFLAETGRSGVAITKSSSEHKPAMDMSWHQADAFCRWVGQRPPTEAEWERAARAAAEGWLPVEDFGTGTWEWVADWYDAGYYAKSPTRDPRGPASGIYRVSRRASEGPAYRWFSYPDSSLSDRGFRCARSLQ